MTSKENADFLLDYAQSNGITSRKELANFMGQMQVESNNFTDFEERFHYSGERLYAVFGGRDGIDSVAKAEEIVKGGPEAIANTVYGGDWGAKSLGNKEPGDGWRFRGRGYIQLTGRHEYILIGNKLRLDLANHPDMAADRDIAAKIAVQYWNDRVISKGHEEDVGKATHDINKANRDLERRRTYASEWEHKLERGYVPGAPELARALHHDMYGDDVQQIQQELAQLGYTDARGRAIHTDGSYGEATTRAVKTFQHDHGLKEDGKAGDITQRAIAATLHESQRITAALSPKGGFSDPSHPQNALYSTLKTELPANTTPEWLAHATAACYMAGIKQPGDLGNIISHGDKVIFGSQSLHSLSSVIDVTQSPPSVQQTMQQVRHYDQQQTHMMDQIHAQNAQLNQQVPTR